MAAEQPPRIGLFVAAHKPWPLPAQPLYRPLGLGGYRPGDAPDALTDADGDNIAERNPHYSELTGWYWIWKNVRDLDVVGLCHYRRYFFLQPGHPGFHADKLYLEPTAKNMAGPLFDHPEPLISHVTHQGGVIVPRPTTFPGPVSWQYAHCHRGSDWQAFLQAIAETSPAHARRLKHFDTSRQLTPYNMMIAPWSFFDDYMALLMAVLEKTETLIDYPDDPYQQRIPAFLAERLFTLHLVALRPKRLEVPVLITDRQAH